MGTPTPGIARINLPKQRTHAGFPGLCRLADGRLLHVWRDGPEHTGGSDGRILGQRLTAGFHPLGAPFLLFDWALDVRDPSVSLSRDGSTVYLTFFSYTSATDHTSWFSTSTDEGTTFGAPVRIDPGSTRLATTAPVVQRPNGTLLAFCYGRRIGNEARDSAYAYRSTNGGASWSPVTMANGPAAGRDYQEPWAISLRNGAVLAALRYGSQDRIAVTASLDDGGTWSAVTPKFPGWGRPALVELATGPTICVYRSPIGFPYHALYRVSQDRGGTWSPGATLATAGAQMTSAAPIEIGDGLVAMSLGLESNATTSSLIGLHMLDV